MKFVNLLLVFLSFCYLSFGRTDNIKNRILTKRIFSIEKDSLTTQIKENNEMFIDQHNILCDYYIDTTFTNFSKVNRRVFDGCWKSIRNSYRLIRLVQDTINSLKEKKLIFIIKPDSKHPALFWHEDFSIRFKSVATITNEAMHEELFHAYQHLKYNLTKYTGKGQSNIEFEAKLALDLEVFRTQKEPVSGAVKGKYRDEYVEWLSTITNWGEHFPVYNNSFKKKYFYFLRKFVTYWKAKKNENYSSPINYNLHPIALFNLINKKI